METISDGPNWLTLAAYLAAVFAAGATGAMFPTGSWYAGLRKPGWTPPNWLFPIAWTALYLAMAVAAWRVSGSNRAGVDTALALWAWQITMNAIWTPVFFGARRMDRAFVIICVFWVAVVSTTIAFWRIDLFAGLLMAPYVVWVSYATALNLALWRMNPDALGERQPA